MVTLYVKRNEEPAKERTGGLRSGGVEAIPPSPKGRGRAACAKSVRVTSPAVKRSRVCRKVTSSTLTLLRWSSRGRQAGQIIEGKQMPVVGGNHQFAFLARQCSDWGHIGVDQRPEKL
jgi:hypothetical protein